MIVIIVAIVLFAAGWLCLYGNKLLNFLRMETKGGEKLSSIDLIKEYITAPKDYTISDDEILRNEGTRIRFISFTEYLTFYRWYRGR